MLIVLIPFLYPLVFLVSTAVKPRAQFVESPNALIPSSVDWSHLEAAWNRAHMAQAMANSLAAVLIGVAVVVALSVPAAFWLFVSPGRTTTGIRVALLATMSFPLIAMVIPLFVILSALELIDNLAVLGVLYGTVNAPFGIYLIYAQMTSGFPESVLEAASVDGAGYFKSFWHIAVPLCAPAIATLAALAFVWTWGDLLLAVVLLQDSSKATSMIAVANLSGQRDALDVQLNAAAALIAVLPVLPVFLVAQKALARGFSLGGAGK